MLRRREVPVPTVRGQHPVPARVARCDKAKSRNRSAVHRYAHTPVRLQREVGRVAMLRIHLALGVVLAAGRDAAGGLAGDTGAGAGRAAAASGWPFGGIFNERGPEPPSICGAFSTPPGFVRSVRCAVAISAKHGKQTTVNASTGRASVGAVPVLMRHLRGRHLHNSSLRTRGVLGGDRNATAATRTSAAGCARP